MWFDYHNKFTKIDQNQENRKINCFLKLLRNNGQYIINISTSSMCYDLFVKTSMHIGMILYHLIMKYGQNTKVKTEYMYYVGIQNI